MENNIGAWLAKRAFLTPHGDGYVGDEGSALTFSDCSGRSVR